ncbi:type IV toxin-antitoxin system AbiEi family antitoxin domain-containing protein [Microbacteriaceae bacterium VKM Ac-2854]|nr:type IV toxin-antitoxin system AbiEi family antitoxin domain-containing protein [Microbacteriaceae bacterium VKM Ac-2854]
MKRLGDVAMQRWGLITTAQAEQVGVSRKVMSRLAATGSVSRVAHGVYRMAGAPELEHEDIFATWLALGGAALPPTEDGVPALVAAGRLATILHGIGDWYPDGYDFIVPSRRDTKVAGVRLTARRLVTREVTHVDCVPTLTIERVLADLVAYEDLSLVVDALRDACLQGRFLRFADFCRYLDGSAAANQFASGEDFALDLLDQAGFASAYRNA